LGDFRIEHELRSTAAGTLYRAKQLSGRDGRPPRHNGHSSLLERVLAATAVEYPHLLPVYDWSECDDLHFAILRDAQN